VAGAHLTKALNLLPFASAFLCILAGAFAEDPTPIERQPPPIREIEPGVLQIGQVRVNKDARTITFPAKVNLVDGALEYGLVAGQGKTHEALLATEAEPYHLHVAMLLLGITPPKQPVTAPDTIDDAFLQEAPELKGDPIQITVAWPGANGPERWPLEELLLNGITGAVAERGTWLYTGSGFVRGQFQAQADGSIIALVADPGALINNPRKGNRNDDAWSPNKEKLPAVNTAVEITVTIPEKSSP
jgi:hypothetical protein